MGRERIGILDDRAEFDVGIVGCGFGGTVLAQHLVARGVKTLVLESGGGLARWLADRRLHQLAAYEHSGNTDYPLKHTKARALGGNSNFWTGRAERFHPSDFRTHPYTPRGNHWPISYGDLEPYYGRAEQTLQVRGGDFSPHAAPRSSGLPFPPTTDIGPLRAILAPANVTLDYSATATPRRAVRFFRVNREILPSFISSPHLALIPNATVTRLDTDASGRVFAAEVAALDGSRRRAHARTWIIACGGIETPRLLLLSRSARFPYGIGNTHDRVGRGFNEHASVNFYGRFRHHRGTIRVRHKIGRSHQFYERYRDAGLGALLLSVIQSWAFPNHLFRFRWTSIPRGAAAIVGRIARPTLYLGATIEMVIRPDNRVMLSSHQRDCFDNPSAHLVFNWADEDRRMLECARELILDIFHRLGITDVAEAEGNFSHAPSRHLPDGH